MVFTRLLGWGLIITGLFFAVAMPAVGKQGYMPDTFANSIVLIGAVLTGIGIYLVVKT
ncbi:MAG: hypothetical protein HYW24_00460 [Candidatus Aenigmarchaeota archaeon]|nr:hypothetical protein [Candidatus Aenigmarchaeota archaeon]